MCPKCGGMFIRDQRTSDPAYCIACGYVNIQTVSISEGLFTRNRDYELVSTVDPDDWGKVIASD